MNLFIVIALLVMLIWLIAIKFANQIGNFTKRFIIDPIKGLFE